MTQKKPNKDRHKSSRRGVQFPAEWLAVAESIAAERPMPVLWWFIELVKREAEAKGRTDLPALPWKSEK